jgi:predicted lipoprotein with Yx(FWY)xxD motif
MKRDLTLFSAIAVTLAVAALAAGCGNSGGGSYSAAYGSPAGATKQAGASLGVTNTPLGTVVVDTTGRTLYAFEKDENHRSACYGACAREWPPLLATGSAVARHGLERSLLGRARRANGDEQITYAGHPLYRFAGDSRRGETAGEGLDDFGAGWDVLSPAGAKIEDD